MLDEKNFLEMIYDVVDIARVNGNKISTKDVDDYFDDMELSPEQLELVYDYLAKGNITVQGYIPSFNGNSSNDSLQNNAAKNENSNTGDIIDNKSGNVLKGEKKVTETSPYTKEYHKAIKEIQNSEIDIKVLFDRITEDGFGKSMRDEIMTFFLPTVFNFAARYANRGVLTDELIQEGNMALLIAVNELENTWDDMNFNSHTSFEKYIKDAIRTGIIKCIDDEVFEQAELSAAIGKAELVKEAIQFLAKENGTVATLRELSEYTHIPEEELSDIISFTNELKVKDNSERKKINTDDINIEDVSRY